jgi:hypothetical protein
LVFFDQKGYAAGNKLRHHIGAVINTHIIIPPYNRLTILWLRYRQGRLPGIEQNI